MDIDRFLERLAKTQHGFVSRDQCVAAGLTESQIKTRVRTRGWTRYLPGVLLLPGIKVSTEGRLQAAQLWGGAQSILSHGAAAWLHGIDEQQPTSTDLYVTSGKRTQQVRCHRLELAAPPATVRRRGLVFTRVERTLSDLAGSLEAEAVG